MNTEEIKQRLECAHAFYVEKKQIRMNAAWIGGFATLESMPNPAAFFDPKRTFEIVQPDPVAERLARNEEVKKRAEGMTWDDINHWFVDEDGKAWTCHLDGSDKWGRPGFSGVYMREGTYELRPVPIPEQNAATRKEWDAMTLGGTCSVEGRSNIQVRRDTSGTRFYLRAHWSTGGCSPLAIDVGHVGSESRLELVPLPAPTVEPWTFETFPEGRMKVRRKSDRRPGLAAPMPDGVLIGYSINGGRPERATYTQLRDDFEQLDGSACGNVKEAK